MNYFCIYFLFFSLLITSCKDLPESLLSNPVIYENLPVDKSVMKVFTFKGEVTDSGIINRLKDQFEYILCGPELFKSGGEFMVKILDKNSLELKLFEKPDSDTLRIYNTMNITIWESLDTISMPLINFLYFGRIYEVFKYKPLYYEEIPLPFNTGYNKAIKYKNCYFVKRNRENFIMPMLDILQKGEMFFFPICAINNEIIIDSIYFSLNTDTLIVNSYFLELTERK